MNNTSCFKITFGEFSQGKIDYVWLRKIFEVQKYLAYNICDSVKAGKLETSKQDFIESESQYLALNIQNKNKISMLDTLEQALITYENQNLDYVYVFLTGGEVEEFRQFVNTKYNEKGLRQTAEDTNVSFITHLGFGFIVYEWSTKGSEVQSFFEKAWEIVRDADNDELRRIYERVERVRTLGNKNFFDVRAKFIETLRSFNKQRRNRQLAKFYNEIMGF